MCSSDPRGMMSGPLGDLKHKRRSGVREGVRWIMDAKEDENTTSPFSDESSECLREQTPKQLSNRNCNSALHLLLLYPGFYQILILEEVDADPRRGRSLSVLRPHPRTTSNNSWNTNTFHALSSSLTFAQPHRQKANWSTQRCKAHALRSFRPRNVQPPSSLSPLLVLRLPTTFLLSGSPAIPNSTLENPAQTTTTSFSTSFTTLSF